MNHKTLNLLIVGLLGICILCVPLSPAATGQPSSAANRPDLEYLKAVNQAAPPEDPQLLFLLMSQYASANRPAEGAEFLSARLNEFEPRLTGPQKALYLSAIALLRAQHAHEVPLLHRIGWVKETITMLDRAKQLSGGQVFVVNWSAGTLRAQLPGRFHQEKAAKEELQWCIENIEKAPHVAWLREVYYQLARLANADGDKTRSAEYLRRSGYTDFKKRIVLTTPFSEDHAGGHTFAPRRIAEIVPGRLYALSGFEFTEYYFVVTEDRQQLIGIDAGTRPDSARAAYEALRAHAPELPKLTTVFVTHAHWDHVGGHTYFRSLNPDVRFYARSNYQQELARELDAPGNLARFFFGERFKMADLRNFKADVVVDHSMDLTVGGTHVTLTPIQGGETPDGMFIELPDLGVLFVGDFIMPYLGAPFVEEGNLQGLLDAIDIVVEKNPKYLLHGHEPLTRTFVSPAMLSHLKTDLIWLQEQVLSAIRRGDNNAAIQQANLIPPELLAHHPDAQVGYLLLREHVIDRLYDQNVGYWQADLTGISHLSRADHAQALVDYLGVSERQLVNALQSMIKDGKYELAASLLESSGERFANSESMRQTSRLIYLKLMEQHQNYDPFKFLLYSAKAGEQTLQISR
ncbi:MAG TPA: MBL fold metallo-hydrolase [Candidatus Limnocylindrales bacterium]|jgi:glyoxylase-like metal-dependent hydrolase (beta-lactamase superfamily II)|nr:MBL fold metallo-hydrolase [Candidatus Limnocylindrales bacterium]